VAIENKRTKRDKKVPYGWIDYEEENQPKIINDVEKESPGGKWAHRRLLLA